MPPGSLKITRRHLSHNSYQTMAARIWFMTAAQFQMLSEASLPCLRQFTGQQWPHGKKKGFCWKLLISKTDPIYHQFGLREKIKYIQIPPSVSKDAIKLTSSLYIRRGSIISVCIMCEHYALRVSKLLALSVPENACYRWVPYFLRSGFLPKKT